METTYIVCGISIVTISSCLGLRECLKSNTNKPIDEFYDKSKKETLINHDENVIKYDENVIKYDENVINRGDNKV